MLKIVGYTNKLTVAPGEEIDLMVSSFGAETYTADFRQIIQGDTNPEGPGYKDKLIDLDLGSTRKAIAKPFQPGSCIIIPDRGVLSNLKDFTIAVAIQPTLIGKSDTTIINIPGCLEIGMDVNGCLYGCLSNNSTLRIDNALTRGVWHLVVLSYDAKSDKLTLSLETDRDALNEPPKREEISTECSGWTSANATECIIAASRKTDDQLTNFFDGKIDRPAIFNKPLPIDEIRILLSDFVKLRKQRTLLAAWDFSQKMQTQTILDISPYHLDGKTHNVPARAMTGWMWKGQELDWKKRPELYSAIHFHSTDMYDAGWDIDFSVTIPSDQKSGVYSIRLVPDGNEEEAYYCVFVVRPPREKITGNTVAFLFPTCSYMAYANHRLGMDVPGTEIGMGRAVEIDQHHAFLQDNPEIGFSLYEVHDDESGVFHTSRLRPIVDLQPKVKSFLGGLGSNIWQFNADSHILGWLDAIEQDYDVISDEDLHEDGLRILEQYNVILTGSHPEYYTRNMMEALQGFTDRGGRLMYLGGNGFYWVVSFNEDIPGIMECRRSEAGIRPWEPGHGQFYHGFTGEYGGLWRKNGHPPNHLCGVGMTSQGFDISEPYVVNKDAINDRSAFIFEGISGDKIGAFGLAGGGAAGLEVDRADTSQGTPSHALVLASSTRHTDIYLMTPEDLLDPTPEWSGTQAEIIRADLTFFETAGGGAVFSTGSIAWSGSVAWNNYDNEIAQMTKNVLKRFDNPELFEIPSKLDS